MYDVKEKLRRTPLGPGFDDGWLRIGTMRGSSGWPRTDHAAYRNAVLYIRSREHASGNTTVEMFKTSSRSSDEALMNASLVLSECVQMGQKLIKDAEAAVVQSDVLWSRIRRDVPGSQSWTTESFLPYTFEMTTARVVPEERKFCAGDVGCCVAIGVNMVERDVPVRRIPATVMASATLNSMTQRKIMEMFVKFFYQQLDGREYRDSIGGSYVVVGQKQCRKPAGFIFPCLNPSNRHFYFRDAYAAAQAKRRKQERYQGSRR